MFTISEQKELIQKFAPVSSIFEYYRMVDPIENIVYKIVDGKAVHTDDMKPCYSLWNREKPCKNCVSFHACNLQKQFFKIE